MAKTVGDFFKFCGLLTISELLEVFLYAYSTLKSTQKLAFFDQILSCTYSFSRFFLFICDNTQSRLPLVQSDLLFFVKK